MNIETIAVLGAGQMGRGIAQIAALSGYNVIVCDVSSEVCKKGFSAIDASLLKLTEKGRITEYKRDAVLAALKFTDRLEDVADADFVIEATPEIFALKHEIFEKLGKICCADAILCTNTSSMSVSKITADCENPMRCAGMHFFFPVHAMKLVEIIRAKHTSNETVNAVRRIATSFGKVSVECKTDTAGFIVNRCLFAFMLEAIREYEEGVASIEDIDTAIKMGLNHPLGPFEMMDMSGLDTFPHVTETLETLPITDWSCPESLRKLVSEGKLGRKNGEGWYKYK